MLKKIRIAGMILSGFISMNIYAGYGIDCEKPVITSVSSNTSIPFSFTCTNNTVATFSYFTLTINELDKLPPATVSFTVTWPHSSNNIRPGDVGIVTGTMEFPTTGAYSFDFDKAYGGEEYKGIFCKNDGDQDDDDNISNCVNVKPAPRFAYIASTDIIKCDVNPSNGNLDACTSLPIGVLHHASDLAIMTLNNQPYIYATGGANDFGVIRQCAINNATGEWAITACQTAGSIVSNIDLGIAFLTTNNQLNVYITDGSENGQVWKCPVITGNGLFGTCAPQGQLYANGGAYLGFFVFDSQTYGYIPDGNFSVGQAAQVWQCKIDSLGNFPAHCADSGAGLGFEGPLDIQFLQLGDQMYAYVTNWHGNFVSKCSVNQKTGQLIAPCITVVANQPHNTGISIIEVNNQYYAYITVLSDGTVNQCAIDSQGNFDSCPDAGPGAIFGIPRGIVFFP